MLACGYVCPKQRLGATGRHVEPKYPSPIRSCESTANQGTQNDSHCRTKLKYTLTQPNFSIRCKSVGQDCRTVGEEKCGTETDDYSCCNKIISLIGCIYESRTERSSNKTPVPDLNKNLLDNSFTHKHTVLNLVNSGLSKYISKFPRNRNYSSYHEKQH